MELASNSSMPFSGDINHQSLLIKAIYIILMQSLGLPPFQKKNLIVNLKGGQESPSHHIPQQVEVSIYRQHTNK
jgi:hypothetical protein